MKIWIIDYEGTIFRGSDGQPTIIPTEIGVAEVREGPPSLVYDTRFNYNFHKIADPAVRHKARTTFRHGMKAVGIREPVFSVSDGADFSKFMATLKERLRDENVVLYAKGAIMERAVVNEHGIYPDHGSMKQKVLKSLPIQVGELADYGCPKAVGPHHPGEEVLNFATFLSTLIADQDGKTWDEAAREFVEGRLPEIAPAEQATRERGGPWQDALEVDVTAGMKRLRLVMMDGTLEMEWDLDAEECWIPDWAPPGWRQHARPIMAEE